MRFPKRVTVVYALGHTVYFDGKAVEQGGGCSQSTLCQMTVRRMCGLVGAECEVIEVPFRRLSLILGGDGNGPPYNPSLDMTLAELKRLIADYDRAEKVRRLAQLREDVGRMEAELGGPVVTGSDG